MIGIGDDDDTPIQHTNTPEDQARRHAKHDAVRELANLGAHGCVEHWMFLDPETGELDVDLFLDPDTARPTWALTMNMETEEGDTHMLSPPRRLVNIGKEMAFMERVGLDLPAMTHKGALRRWAYGVLTYESGRQVMFNRAYRPLFERDSAKSPARPANPHEHVNGSEAKFFWDDWDHPRHKQATRDKLKRVFKEWGLALPEIFNTPLPGSRESKAA